MRKPTVGPGCTTRSADSDAPSTPAPTRGVFPAVLDRVGAGCRHRAATAPDLHPHRLLPPEDRHDADEFVRVREEREGCYGDLPLDAVRARHAIPLVRRAPLVESDPGRPTLERERLVRVEGPRLESPRPFVVRHLTHLRERLTEYRLRRLVEEHEPASLVDDQGRRREVRCELAREDQDEVLLLDTRHRQTVRRNVEPHEGDGRALARLPVRRERYRATRWLSRDASTASPKAPAILAAASRSCARIRSTACSVAFSPVRSATQRSCS